MAMSKEALEAVEAIRRDLKVVVSVREESRYFDSPGRLNVGVKLMLGDEVISQDEDWVSVPD